MAKNKHAVALGRKGGQAVSERKAEASRQNGRKGGRPKTVTSEATATAARANATQPRRKQPPPEKD